MLRAAGNGWRGRLRSSDAVRLAPGRREAPSANALRHRPRRRRPENETGPDRSRPASLQMTLRLIPQPPCGRCGGASSSCASSSCAWPSSAWWRCAWRSSSQTTSLQQAFSKPSKVSTARIIIHDSTEIKIKSKPPSFMGNGSLRSDCDDCAKSGRTARSQLGHPKRSRRRSLQRAAHAWQVPRPRRSYPGRHLSTLLCAAAVEAVAKAARSKSSDDEATAFERRARLASADRVRRRIGR